MGRALTWPCKSAATGAWRRRRAVFAGVLVATLAGGVVAEHVPGAASVARVAAEPTVAERIAWIEAELEKARVEARTPGAGVAIIVDGKIVLSRGFGLADVASGREVTADTRFAVGSTTKAFTATLCVMLAEEGAMSLDDHPRKFLPEFAISDAEADEKVTIRDLLCHRTGHAAMTQVWYGVEGLSREDVLECYAKAELLHPFRSAWNYSNESFLAAGLASAAAAKTDWDSLLAARLFKPLGMTGANSTLAAAKADVLMATGYYLDPTSDAMETQPMRLIDHVAPAGSINASAADMARWVMLQLGRGTIDGEQLLSRESIEETWKSHSKMSGSIGYGLGWMIADWEGKRLITHAGGIDGFTAEVAFVPDEGFGVVILTNHFGTPFAQQGREIALRGMFKDLPSTVADLPNEENFDRMLGMYIANFGPFKDAEMPVSVQNGRLAVLVPGQTTYELRGPSADGKRPFALTDAIAVTFNEDKDGNVYSFTFHQGGMNFEVFKQGASAPLDIDLAEASELCGVYRIDAGGPQIDVDVRIENNRLAVNVPGQMVYSLYAPDAEGWWVFRATDMIRVRFDRDDEGNVVSMTQRQSGNDIVMNRVGNLSDQPSLPSVADLMTLIAETLDTEGRIKSLEVSGAVVARHQGLAGTQLLLSDSSGRVRSHSNLGHGRVSDSWVGASGGTSRVYAVAEDIPMTPGMCFGLLQQTPLFWMRDWREQFERVRVVGKEQRDGGETYVVHCSRQGSPATIIEVDVSTGRLRSMKVTSENYLGMPVEIETKLDDWRPVEGVMMAHRWEMSVAMAGSSVMHCEKVRVNVPVMDATFEVTPRE
ncbi:MAG: serine hydrolase [Phycisphaeraceae bacterium]|nr:serine hydrolase [Phycisphaeraceae bacterium]MCW5762764.1 serine hydrolase [Phycisphaeraceae bacterium]